VADWSNFTAEEIERRRLASVSALEALGREEFGRWYQEQCDRLYWTRGQCCAGCDHWRSDMGNTGRCAAAGIVSGADVLRSTGVTWSSYIPPPGLPYSQAIFHCGKFRDEFDWSSLDREYLSWIGALRHGQLKPKPQTPAV
jgi:hypothetical protein